MFMTNSPPSNDSISITVNPPDADVQTLKLLGEDDSHSLIYDVVPGASPISSYAPSPSPMSSGWSAGALGFRDAPGSPHSPYSDPPSPYQYGTYSGPPSPYLEHSPDSSHNSSPIIQRMSAMELSSDQFFSESHTSSGYTSPTPLEFSRGRSSSRSTESLGHRRDMSQLALPAGLQFPEQHDQAPEALEMSELLAGGQAQDEVFEPWLMQSQPALSIEVDIRHHAPQDQTAFQPHHRRGLSASSNDPFFSGFSPPSHASSPSGDASSSYGLQLDGLSPVSPEAQLDASISSRRYSHSDTRNGHGGAPATRGRSHSRTSSSASSSRMPSPYARPENTFLSVPDATNLRRRHSHTGGRSGADNGLLTPGHQVSLQRHISAPSPRSREPSPARMGHRPCASADQSLGGMPNTFALPEGRYPPLPSPSPYLLPPAASPGDLHSQSGALSPGPFGASSSDDLQFNGPSSYAPPTTVSPQELHMRGTGPARFGHRATVSEDRLFSGTNSLSPPDALSRRSSSPYLAPPDTLSPDELHSPGAQHDPDRVKETVASRAILQASTVRRKKSADFRCTYNPEKCNATFTAKHNLTNHMNSHMGIKPHTCKYCGHGFTTSGTARRHEGQCSSNPEKQAGPSLS